MEEKTVVVEAEVTKLRAGSVEVELRDNGLTGHVTIDGKEVKGITEIVLEMTAPAQPRLTLKVIPGFFP